MLRKIALTTIALSLTSACALAAPEAAVSPQIASVIEASCTSIMGLHHGEFAYLGCRESLTATAARMAQGQSRLAAYDACRARGLAQGSAGLSTCILDNDREAPIQAASVTVAPASVPAALVAASSYYSVTHAVQWQREQYSCAQLGLVPGSAAFTGCVASIDADVQP